MKLYVATVEALGEKGKTGWNSVYHQFWWFFKFHPPLNANLLDETQFTTNFDGFLSFIPPWMLIYFFAGFFFNLTLCMTKLRVLVLCFSYFTDNSNMLDCKERREWMNGVSSGRLGKWFLPSFEKKVSKCNNDSLWQFVVDQNQSWVQLQNLLFFMSFMTKNWDLFWKSSPNEV